MSTACNLTHLVAPALFVDDPASVVPSIQHILRDHDRALKAQLRPLDQLSAAERQALGTEGTIASLAAAWETNDAALRALLNPMAAWLTCCG